MVYRAVPIESTAEVPNDLGITAVGQRRKQLDAIAILPAAAVKIEIAAPAISSPSAAEAERRQVSLLKAKSSYADRPLGVAEPLPRISFYFYDKNTQFAFLDTLRLK